MFALSAHPSNSLGARGCLMGGPRRGSCAEQQQQIIIIKIKKTNKHFKKPRSCNARDRPPTLSPKVVFCDENNAPPPLQPLKFLFPPRLFFSKSSAAHKRRILPTTDRERRWVLEVPWVGVVWWNWKSFQRALSYFNTQS